MTKPEQVQAGEERTCASAKSGLSLKKLKPSHASMVSARTAWASYVGALVALAVVLVLLKGDEYFLGLAAVGILFAALACAWNIIGGFGGQFSLGHAVFFGVGAYSVCLLRVNHGWSPWLALVVGAVLSAIVALLLAWPLFRLSGVFFAIGTMVLAEVAFALSIYFEWTGGAAGVTIPFAMRTINDTFTWGVIFLGFLAACLAVSILVVRGRLGYYLVAVKENHEAASAAGASPLAVKTIGLVISAVLTAIGGGLFIMYLGFLDPPSVFSLVDVGVFIPLLALVGGIGTIVGPVLGGLLLQPAQAYFRGEFADLPPGTSQAFIGVLLIVVALYFQDGIWGKVKNFMRKKRDRRD